MSGDRTGANTGIARIVQCVSNVPYYVRYMYIEHNIASLDIVFYEILSYVILPTYVILPVLPLFNTLKFTYGHSKTKTNIGEGGGVISPVPLSGRRRPPPAPNPSRSAAVCSHCATNNTTLKIRTEPTKRTLSRPS